MTMIISVEHGATLLPANSPVIGSARSAPFSDDEVSGPPLFPDQGLPLNWTPPAAPPQAMVKTRKGQSATAAVVVVAVPLDAGDPGGADPSYDEAVEKLLWYLVVG